MIFLLSRYFCGGDSLEMWMENANICADITMRQRFHIPAVMFFKVLDDDTVMNEQ